MEDARITSEQARTGDELSFWGREEGDEGGDVGGGTVFIPI